MPVYQIHRLKDMPRQQFRWAPHTPGVTVVKPKDYERGSVMEAATPYALWLALKEGENALKVGDLVEVVAVVAGSVAVVGEAPGESVHGAAAAATAEVLENTHTRERGRGEGEILPPVGGPPLCALRILKYIGFEEARWYVPEPASSTIPEPVAVT